MQKIYSLPVESHFRAGNSQIIGKNLTLYLSAKKCKNVEQNYRTISLLPNFGEKKFEKVILGDLFNCCFFLDISKAFDNKWDEGILFN